MAEIIIQFRDMAIFALDGKGTTIVFPKLGHNLKVTPDSNYSATPMLPQSPKSEMRLLANGKRMPPERTVGPAGEYAVNLEWAMRRNARFSPSMFGKAIPRSLNGRIRIQGGYFVEYPTLAAQGKLAERKWDFGGGRQHKISDRMDFHLPVKRGVVYELDVNGQRMRLRPDSPIVVWNSDPQPEGTQPTGLLTSIPEFATLSSLGGGPKIVPTLVGDSTVTLGEGRPCPFSFLYA